MTLDEAKTLRQNQWIYHKTKMQGTERRPEPLRVRVTSVKTWKRDPNRVEVRVVHGLRGFGLLRDIEDWTTVEPGSEP